MITLFLAGLMALQTRDGPAVTVEQLDRILQAEVFPARDLALVYEGTFRDIGSGDPKAGSSDQDFQGIFLMRSDGAGTLDVYERPLAPTASVVRNKRAVLRNEQELVRGILDSKQRLDRDRDIAKGRGSFLALTGTGTPFQIWVSLVLKHAGYLDQLDYVQEGWEVVDGRKCLVFKAAIGPGWKTNDHFRRFWMDLERGANVLKFEIHEKGKLIRRVHGVELEEFKASDGRSVWIPIRGRVDSFLWRDEIRTSPVFRETVSVVHGTVQLDMDLPDVVFTVKRAATTSAPKSLGRLIRTSLDMPLPRMFSRQTAEHARKADLASRVKARADQQVEEIKASSAAREQGSWTSHWPWALGSASIILLVVAVIRRGLAR